MRILVVGGGPGGLYFSILAKREDPSLDITVIERNGDGVTFGWGVVFSDETLGHLLSADAPTHEQIAAGFAHWDAIDNHYRGERLRSVGHGFSGIARRELLQILTQRARDLGITIRFDTEYESFDSFSDYDLVVAADGVNSRIREHFAESFQPDLDLGQCRFVMPFDEEEQAIGLANDSDFGLYDYVYSGDAARAWAIAQRLRAGNVGINTLQRNHEAPFGGFKQSGLGRDGGSFGLHAYSELQSVVWST